MAPTAVVIGRAVSFFTRTVGVTVALLLLLALFTQEGSAGGLFPQRIVSLAPSLTEILYAVGAGDQVVGVTTFCDYPPEALKKPKIGGMVDPNLEAIVAMRPDLVLATMEGNREETVRQLERLGLRVVVVNPTGVSGILRAIETVGRVTALESRAQRVVTNLRNRLDRVARAISGRPRPRVLYLLWTEPTIVPGRDTVITDLISRAGGESVSGQEPLPYPRYSLEEVVAKAPEIVILAAITPGKWTSPFNLGAIRPSRCRHLRRAGSIRSTEI